jgi:hypothetical protein
VPAEERGDTIKVTNRVLVLRGRGVALMHGAEKISTLVVLPLNRRINYLFSDLVLLLDRRRLLHLSLSQLILVWGSACRRLITSRVESART